MSKPNFFIVGAPRCGTTSLYSYLREHPHVFMAEPKELTFFAPDLSLPRAAGTEHAYGQLFRPATAGQWRVGEASAIYLYSREAPSLVHTYAPDAKIVILVRNPLDLLQSWHAQVVYDWHEDRRNFAEAWDLRFRRREDQWVPARCLDRKLLWYDKIARMGEQTQRWLRHFPRDRVRIFSFDDLKADTGAVYRDVLEFLDLPDDGRQQFPVMNTRKSPRLRLLAMLTERTPQPLICCALAVKRLIGIRQWGVLRALRRWNNTVPPPATPLDRRVVCELLDTYADDVALLSQVSGRDFSHWLEGHPCGKECAHAAC